MKTLLRRYLVLATLFFWQGGFLFYSAVVVPIGQEVLQTNPAGVSQGFITRQVTVYLNLAGLIALPLLLADALVGRPYVLWRQRFRLTAWVGMAITLALLAWFHPQLDTFLDSQLHIIEDRRNFRFWHRWYLWTSTVQWVCGLVYTFLMLLAWRHEDASTAAHPRPTQGSD